VWAANAGICEKVTPSLLGDVRTPRCSGLCQMCALLYPAGGLEIPGMIMRGAYGHIKHHRQAYHGAVSLVDAAMQRRDRIRGRPVTVGFAGCDDGPASPPYRPHRRATDRAYLAWATGGFGLRPRISAARLAAISQPQLHDRLGTDAAGVAMLAPVISGHTLCRFRRAFGRPLRRQARVLFSMAASSAGSAPSLAPNLLDVFAAV